MKAIYLKFPDEKTAEAVKAYEGRDVEGYSVDIIGGIDGADGFHVNMLVPDDFAEFKAYEIEPQSPRQIFAGWGK